MSKLSQSLYRQVVTKELKQQGTSSKIRDEPRKAMLPGRRVSKNGKIYWETRKNRSDKYGEMI